LERANENDAQAAIQELATAPFPANFSLVDH
jgi:hypothetical protein